MTIMMSVMYFPAIPDESVKSMIRVIVDCIFPSYVIEEHLRDIYDL